MGRKWYKEKQKKIIMQREIEKKAVRQKLRTGKTKRTQEKEENKIGLEKGIES